MWKISNQRGQIILENLGPKIKLSAVKEDRQSVKVTLGSLHFSQNVNTQIKRGKLIDCKVKTVQHLCLYR